MAEPEPPRRAPRGPFIMPDGRPLTAVLEQQQQLTRRGGGTSHKARPGRIKEPKEGWSKAMPRAATAATAAVGAGSSVPSEAEAAELYALSRVGQRKQRRWLNDKLLRDMAGALTASDMASLFKPVPFGEPRSSLWERAAQPEHAVLWDLFRSLEMDKQARVLQKWEAHVRELQSGPSAIHSPAVEAIAAWAGVSWKARQAMKRSSPSHVASIEAPILAFLQEEGPGSSDEMVLQDLEDGFHRLIAHGLAEYHSLSSHSRPTPGGGKEVVLRRRAAGAGSAAAAAASSGGSSAAGGSGGSAAAAAGAAGASPMAADAGGEGGQLLAGERLLQDGQQGQGQGQQLAGTLVISCADILHILEDEKQPLCPAILHQAYLHPIDSSSEAGDFHTGGMGGAEHPHHRGAHQPAVAAAAAAEPAQMVLAAS